MAKLLIAKGLDVNEKNIYGETPLFWAAAGNGIKVAEVLLEHGAVINDQNIYGESPIHYAAANRYSVPQMLALLVQNGANINGLDHQGLTPLRKVKDPDNADFLIKHGAKVHFNGEWCRPVLDRENDKIIIKNNKGMVVTSIELDQ